MPRKPREILPGGIYHAWARGNDRQPIFVDNYDRRRYLWILGDIVEEFGWNSLGYCLMPNHIHLLIETPEPNLSQGMQRLQLRYVQRFNRRHERSGHLFGERFKSKRITSDLHLATVTEYIANNPVVAGLCQASEKWPWTDVEPARERCAEAFGPARSVSEM